MILGGGLGFAAFGLLWLASAVLSIVLVVVLIMVAVRYLNRTSTPPVPGPGQWPGQPPAPVMPVAPLRPDPLEILRERFARGEITVDEFETAKRALGYPSSDQPSPDTSVPPTA